MTAEEMETIADMIASRLMDTFAARLDMIEEVVFSGVAAESHAEEESKEMCAAILERWYFAFTDRSVHVKDIIQEIDDDPNGSLSLLVRKIVTPSGEFTGRCFGGWLRRNKGRTSNGYRLEVGSRTKKEPGWRVVRTAK